MGNHLTGSAKRLGEAHALNDVVQAGFEELKEDFAGDATFAARESEVTPY
jgi:hypothetical protein